MNNRPFAFLSSLKTMVYFCDYENTKISTDRFRRINLENGHKKHPKSHFRQRCHALLLCDVGWQIKSVDIVYYIYFQ